MLPEQIKLILTLSLMKYRISILLIFFSLSITSHATDNYPKNDNIDVQNYSFNIYLSDSCDLISGEAVINILHSGKGSQIQLDLVNINKDQKGMEVQSVLSDGKPVFWEHKNNSLLIKFDREKQDGDKSILLIKYSGIPADGLIISENMYGERTFFSDNWPDRARNWIPCVDHPYDKARVEFIVNAPGIYKVVSNGRLIDETTISDGRKLTHWREDVAIPTKVMVIGVANFASQLAANVKGVDIWTYVFPENREAGFSDYSVASEPLKYYSDLIGEYPYEKLANVQSKTMFGGMENAGCIFYSEKSVTGKNRMERLMAHEIAHQWFGNSVTEYDWHHIWLSEGFATYFTSCYMEDRYGKPAMESLMGVSRQRVIKAYENAPLPIIDTTVTNLMKLLNANSYQKGSWVLHMLRDELGDKVFFTGIRRYYLKFRDGNALTSDFRLIMEEVSDRDLGKFFDQWLIQPSLPVLDLEWEHSRSRKETIIKVVQEQDVYIFDIPLEIEIVYRGRTLRKKVRIDEKNEEIKIKTRRSPVELKIDPDVKLLFINAN